MIVFAVVVGALTVGYLYLKYLNTYWTRRGVKQTDPWPIFGDNLGLLTGTEYFWQMMINLYNKTPGARYFGFYQFMTPTLLIRDSELIKQMMVKDFDHFGDHRGFSLGDSDPFISKTLFSLKGKIWRDMRSTLSPTFTSSKMRQMYVLIKQTADGFIGFFEKLGNGDETIEVEVKDTFTRFTNDVIASTAFGIDVNSMKDRKNEFYTMGEDATNFQSFTKNTKFIVALLAPKFTKWTGMNILGEKVNNFFANVIIDSMKQRKEKNIVRKDVIHLLMEAKKGILKKEEGDLNTNKEGFSAVKDEEIKNSNKTPITDVDIIAQTLGFLFAGFDSVASLMCFMAYELAVNPDVQSRLREEIDQVFEETKGNITYEEVLKMKYLDNVVSETLRKWPNATFTDRVCTKPYTIEPKTPDESTIHLKTGDICWISIMGMHRDPERYPNPEKFDPERFNDENKKNIDQYAYLPFGVGPRACIGSRFALLETKAIFCNILRSFVITPSPKMKNPVEVISYNFTIAIKGGIWLCFDKVKRK